jgi:hypothetical protein
MCHFPKFRSAVRTLLKANMFYLVSLTYILIYEGMKVRVGVGVRVGGIMIKT